MKNFFTSLNAAARQGNRPNLTAAIGSTVARQVFASALYFTSLWITTRALGPQQNGVLATLLLLPQTLFAFLNLGIGPSHVYHLSSGLGNHGSMRVTNWALAAALWAVVALILALCGAPLIARVLPGIGKQEALMASLLFPTMLLAAWSSALIQGQRDYRSYNLTLLVQPLVFCAAILLLRSFGAITPVTVISCTILSQLSLWCASERRISRFGAPAEAQHRFADALRFGLRAHVSNVITFLNYRLALYLVSFMLGASAAGTYALSVQLAEVFWLVSGAAAMIVFPESAAKGRTPAQLQRMIEQVALTVVLITGSGALLAGMLAPLAIPWIFGQDYVGSVLPFVTLLPGVVLWSYMSVISNSLAGMGCQGVNIGGALLCLTINIVGDLFAIPRWGVQGAALASTIAFSCTALFTVIAYKRIMVAKVQAVPI
ncbi:lipopolysaccharide biosynthesis protein [Massilia sp. DWR3-1-1]|uniref:lipopolysaccharide biosynthesis protein n=1 Tax=Massilia sp. DWR3-1-1 TaxID=2804559 RepID=UPI003CF53221